MKNTIKHKGRTYKYNENDGLLKWVYEDEIVDAIGLSQENWRESPEYWVEVYHNELEIELKHMLNYL